MRHFEAHIQCSCRWFDLRNVQDIIACFVMFTFTEKKKSFTEEMVARLPVIFYVAILGQWMSMRQEPKSDRGTHFMSHLTLTLALWDAPWHELDNCTVIICARRRRRNPRNPERSAVNVLFGLCTLREIIMTDVWIFSRHWASCIKKFNGGNNAVAFLCNDPYIVSPPSILIESWILAPDIICFQQIRCGWNHEEEFATPLIGQKLFLCILF